MATIEPVPGEAAIDGRDARTLYDHLEGLFPSGIRRVLLVLPPDIDRDTFNYSQCRIGRYANYPAYGLGLLATHLREEGISARILNLNHTVLKACRRSSGPDDFEFTSIVTEAICSQLESFQPDLVGVSCMFSLGHLSMASTCALLKSLAPALPIALGGVHVTNALVDPGTRETFMRDLPMVDAFFLNEAELALRDFVRVVNGKAPVPDLSQVIIRDSHDAWYFERQNRPSESSMEKLPALDQLCLPELSEFGKIGGFHYLKAIQDRFATILSNRGCRGQCTFCSVKGFNGPGVRLRSVQSVVDELCWLQDQFGITHVTWLDDDFLYDRRHALTLFEAMVKRGLSLTWDCSNGVIAAACTDEVVAAAAASGCIGLVLGVESGNPDLLRAMKKPGSVQCYLRAAQVLHKYPGVNARVFLMFGFPGETRRMMRDTFRVAREMDLDWQIIQVVQPLPNTPLFGQLVAQGQVKPNDYHQVRYSLGYYGKLKERVSDVMTADFRSAFDDDLLDEVPSPPELDVIWAYMNYHLNFERLSRDDRSEKLSQQLRWLEFVTDLVTPEGGIALYCYGSVYRKLHGTVPQQIIERLRKVLKTSVEWRTQFERLGISHETLQPGCTAADVSAAAITGALNR